MVSLIIEDENSSTRYTNQTNGHAWCAGGGWESDASFYDDIPQIMKQLNDYFYDYVFALDENKMDENTESWVHLIGKRTKPESNNRGILQGFPDKFNAVLTWPNSD